MITPTNLEGIDLWEILRSSVGWHSGQLDDLTRHRAIRKLIGLEVTDVIQTTAQKLKESAVRSVDELQQLSYNVVGVSDDLRRRNRQLKDFLYKNMYRHYRVMRMSVKAEQIITSLFEAFRSEPSILPRQFQIIAKERGLERTICDYIAGMTDRYAIEEHRKIFDPDVLP
jgi:dGTPase